MTWQSNALEAIIHAAENGALSMFELEAALGRHRLAKERYLSDLSSKRKHGQVEKLIGRTRSRMIAEEIARYV